MKTALSIAGTDPTGGAGIMADLKSFHAREVYGMAVVTSVVAQNTMGVQKIQNIDLDILESQLKCVFADIVPNAIKTGMLPTKEIMEIIVKYVNKGIPYVIDPVMVASSGHNLIGEDAKIFLKENLFKYATLVTPNIPETETIVDFKIRNEEDIKRAGEKILKDYKPKSVIIKGGHLETDPVDYLFIDNKVLTFSSPRISTKNTHGTGCTFSAVITAELAKGKSLETAVGIAKKFITQAILKNPELGKGHGPLNHFAYKNDI